MKKTKSVLDEMQEQKLLKIEHNGCWLAFWGLVAAIMVQTALDGGNLRGRLGEIVVLILLSVYLVFACLKNGIWDRKLKPDWKTNLRISLLAGLAFGGFWFAVSFYRYHMLFSSVATFVFMFLSVTVLCFAALELIAGVFKKRKEKIETEDDSSNP